MISKLDFLAVPSQDAERSRTFYVDTLGLRPDDNARFEFWAGDTCFGIYEPARYGPDSFPSIPWPETLMVTPPWEGGDGRANNDPKRKKRVAEAGTEVKAGITIARESK